MTIKGLWPEDLRKSEEVTVEDILWAQAQDLAVKTGNVLQGTVERGSQGEWVTLDFFILVPALEDYTYHLLKIRHKLPQYPLEMYWLAYADNTQRARVEADSRKEFETRLGQYLSSPKVRKVLRELLTFSKARAQK
jgi:hypothetical protein